MNIASERTAGILMPVASLPSEDGIGGFGKEAYRFVEYLSEMGMNIWQILPLNPLGFGNSPYQPFSSYAGDEIYIDLTKLEEMGYLENAKRTAVQFERKRIEYQKVREYKDIYLREAYQNFKKIADTENGYLEFVKMEWVYPYAVFVSLKKQNQMKCWNEWPREQQNWILDKAYDISHLEEEINYQMFLQYMFYTQWMELKEYANRRNIKIMGDIPIYVGIDSLDVWQGREDFLLGAEGRPSFVAGVPPDYFSENGQRWGNPIYDWDNLQKKGFTFWVKRLKYSSKLYDIIRIDHFRAFDTYWKIPASCDTAIEGEWVEAPGYALFDEVYKQLPDIQIVAEDLGDLRPEVLALRDHYKLLGMHIAEFHMEDAETLERHKLIYTGTHDNQTVSGWYKSLSGEQRKLVRKKLRTSGMPWESVAKKMVNYVYGSPCCMAIVPLADIIGTDDEARLNTPGTVGSPNWEWRLTDWEDFERQIKRVARLLTRQRRGQSVANK